MTQFINTQRGSKGEKGDPGKSGASLKSVAFVGNDMVFTDTDDQNVVLANAKIDLKGDTGPKGDTGEKGDAATVNVGTTTTGEPGTQASVTNSGTSSAAVFNFTIPRGNQGIQGPKGDKGEQGIQGIQGVKGDTGATGPQGQKGDTGNGIASITATKNGKTNTITVDYTDGTDYQFTIMDGADGEGAGDVLGPSSSTDGHIALFDGTTGKLIKDGNKKISDLQEKVIAGTNITIDNDGKTISAVDTKYDAMSTAEGQGGIAENQRTMTAKNLKEIIQYYTSTFITNSVSNLTNYYLKSETYTKSEVASLIGSIQQFHYEIYANLSDITSPASNVLYLIGPKGSGSDLYEEYVYTTQFIKIGETSIDLSNYVTISALNTALSSYVTSAVFTQTLQDYVTTTNLSQTLSDYVTSSGLNNILANYVTTTSLNTILEDYATTSALGNLSSTVSNLSNEVSGKITNPSGGTEGQVLVKTQNGEAWQDAQGGLPEGGTEGQFIRKTASGSEWVDGELVEIRNDDYSAMQGPAPEGFHIPLVTEWEGLKTIMDGLSLTTGDNWRINLHMPFAGNRDYENASLSSQGSNGLYWSSSPSGSGAPNSARPLDLESSRVSANGISRRAYGFSVRCFKNSFELPTSSWTVIQGTLGSAGIFWDTVNGLISITGDGTTGYTIQDKNLGATTVYNDGDTLSEANCGKYYQWGNNYGFAWTGSVTTSSTQVNASTYGPGNYYSSSTFITVNSSPYDWSSVHNDNLRGGVTGVIPGGKFVGKEKINEVPTNGTEGQVLTKTNSGEERRTIASDHLEERALVGEKYALTDTLFKQLTPKLADSTVEAKVGDVAANTQIHIQRIASGTGSNQLKLKLKKVGTPGNLSVQVMKGVKVTFIANVEAYWYGDSNNVLASGTVSASSITTSWQEITVTLDNKVGGTEGELLDIVLSIPSVNASNYVVIACDSTQWSEAFSYVCVNGTTRTRQKLMPYCISDGFAQALLVKQTNSTVLIDNTNLANIDTSYTTNWSGQNSVYETVYEILDGTTTISGTAYSKTNSSSCNSYFIIWRNNTVIKKEKITDAYYGVYERTIEFTNLTVQPGDLIRYYIECTFSGGDHQTIPIKMTINGNGYIYKKGINGKPRSTTVKSIGSKESTTIYGVHIDNTRFTQS